jgi:hypothetical protein
MLIFNLKVKILIKKKKQNWTKPEKKKDLGNACFFFQNEWKISQEVKKKI